MMKNKEVRSYNFDIRTSDSNDNGVKVIEGRAIVYGSKYDNGMWDEYIDAGALDNCDLKDVRLLINHNTDMIPLARSRNNTPNSTMQLIADEDGLGMRANLDTENNQDSKSLHSAIGRGDITGMSFMFTVDGDKWDGLDTEHPVRHITSINKIFEVSAVTFPAYESTSLEARDELALDSARSVLDSAKQKFEEEQRMSEERRTAIEKQKQRIRILASL